MVRELKETDFDDLRELMHQIHALHVENRPDIYNDVDPLSREYFEFLQNDTNTIALVYDLNSSVVAYCIATLKEPSKNPLLKERKVGVIDALCVDKKIRNKGFGKLVFNEMILKLKTRNITNLELTVWSFNESAVSFYESMDMSFRSYVMEKEI